MDPFLVLDFLARELRWPHERRDSEVELTAVAGPGKCPLLSSVRLPGRPRPPAAVPHTRGGVTRTPVE
jgi:hypothetical protein